MVKMDSIRVYCAKSVKDKLIQQAVTLGYSSVSRYIIDTMLMTFNSKEVALTPNDIHLSDDTIVDNSPPTHQPEDFSFEKIKTLL